MKYFSIVLTSLILTILVGSTIRTFKISEDLVQVSFYLILMYIITLGLMGSLLLAQIVLLAYKVQKNEKAIRTKINDLRNKRKLNIQNFYKTFLQILDLSFMQKEIVKNILKIGISLKVISKN